jgi:purine nucleosidase
MHQSTNFSASEAGQSTQTVHPVFIDTDIGDDIDDALALALALQSPEIDVLGISTVFGDTKLRAHLAAHLVAVFGRNDIPVAAGISEPLRRRHPPSGVAQAAVLSKYLPLPAISSLSGPELLLQTSFSHAGQLTLICIGPLTNLAMALRQEPNLFKALRRVIIMGGSSSLPLADWNIRSDVEAAQIVFASGIPLTCVGLDVTLHCRLRSQDIKRLKKSPTSRAQLLSQLILLWQQHRPRWQPPFPFLHDPLTVTALCHPSVLTFREMPLRIITSGPLEGITIPHLMGGTWVETTTDVAVDDAREWMMQRWLT